MKRNYSRNEKKSKRLQEAKAEKPPPSPVTEGAKEGKWNLEEIEKDKDKKSEMGCCSLFDRIEDVDEFCYRTDKIAFVGFAVTFFIYNIVYIMVYTV